MFGFLKKKFGKTEQAESGQPASADGVDQDLRADAPAAVDEAPATESPVTAPAATTPAAPAAPAATVSVPVPVAAAQVPDQLAAEVPVPEVTVPEVEQPAALALETEAAAPRRSWGDRLKAGLARTRQQLGGGLASLFGRRKIDEDLLEELESTLLMADCGVDATQHLINDLRLRWKRDRLETADQLQKALADGLLDAAILVRYERTLRPAELRWAQWDAGQMSKIDDCLNEIEAQATALGTVRFTIGEITIACALGYLDFRYPEVAWREGRPKAAAWYEIFSKLPAMQATMPPA